MLKFELWVTLINTGLVENHESGQIQGKGAEEGRK